MGKRDPHRACRIRPLHSCLRKCLLPQDSAGLLRGQPMLRRIIRCPDVHHPQRDFPLRRERADIFLIPIRRRPQPVMHMHRLQRPGKPPILHPFIQRFHQADRIRSAGQPHNHVRPRRNHIKLPDE